MKSKDYKLNLLLENFQLNFGPLSDLCIDKVKNNESELWKRYIFDLFISTFVIAPSVIAFWRGTWDYAIEYWNWNFIVRENLTKFNISSSNPNVICEAFDEHEALSRVIMHTVWKFQNFTATRISRETSFKDSRISKTTISCSFRPEALNLVFGQIFKLAIFRL